MKIKIGWWANLAPYGYLNLDSQGKISGRQYSLYKQQLLEENKKQLNRIEPDPLLAPLIRKAFELYAYGEYSLKEVCAKLENEGLKTRDNKRLSKTSLEQVLKNPFYCGLMRWKGELAEGKHEAIISRSLFNEVQEKLLGKAQIKPHSTPQDAIFTYKGTLVCKECKCSITAEEHTKKQENGNVHHYIYYRCTKARGKCSQSYIAEKELEKQFAEIFEDFILSPDQANKIQAKLEELYKDDINYQSNQEKAIVSKLEKLKEEKKNLLRKMALGEIEDQETFTEIKNDIQKEIADLQGRLADIGTHSETWFQQSSNLIYLAKNAKTLFLQGTKEEKQILINCVASNLFLLDKKIEFKLKEEFEILKEARDSNNLLPS